MDTSSYVLLSHDQALRRRLDVIANNMANVSTVGFQREEPVFHEMVRRSDGSGGEGANQVSYVLDYGAAHDTRRGGFQATGNPLDIMIDGPGYLNVETPEGGVAYTRAGFIKVLQSGELATSAGLRLLGEGGKPISIPPDQMANLKITEDGTVLGAQGSLGRLELTVFDDERTVDPRGDGLLTGQGGRALSAAETKLKSGGVEGSNVEAITETTKMIEVLRAYQTSQRMSEGINDMRKRAIERLGRVS
jgi:flagellar basal-body rod protein FlgF